MEITRSSGILLPISALPSKYGIGTFGKAAYQFIDFLVAARQTWWQILPLTTTGYGNSPYQSFSAFAGNPYLIDLDILVEQGLLEADDVETPIFGSDPHSVDYARIYEERMPLLKKAARKGLLRDQTEFLSFRAKENFWLEDYALFTVLKAGFQMKSWLDWQDQKLRNFDPQAVAEARERYRAEITEICYIQFLFFQQWHKLHDYAKTHHIRILGDMPLYVALDSVDVWSRACNYQLGSDLKPQKVSGVPPDYFNSDGQLWSNPLYDWRMMAADNFSWWIERIRVSTEIYDGLRIDHFRGLESYWAVPSGELTARNGQWVKGPGMALISVLRKEFPDFTFVAEDLGYQTPDVQKLLEDSGFPGMNVLQLAFDYRDAGNPLPHEFVRNSVCYIGTHDNAPIMEWRRTADPDDLKRAIAYFGLNEAEGFNWGFIRGGMSSVSNLFIAQMQDFLGLGAESRMNIPGKLAHNWEWRVAAEDLTTELAAKIRQYTSIFGRRNSNSDNKYESAVYC